MARWGWLGSRHGVRGASVEGVCVGAMVLHNMERGESDFRGTQTPGWVVGARPVSALKDWWGLREGHG